MRLFISHAQKDDLLARQLRERLVRVGLAVWSSEEEIAPGDNWAKKIGKALDDAELMVILLTPKAMESERLRQNIEFALGSKKFEGRVYSVIVGPTIEAKEVPWILWQLPHRQVESTAKFGEVAKEIHALAMTPQASPSHA